jgi:hypothetical protein
MNIVSLADAKFFIAYQSRQADPAAKPQKENIFKKLPPENGITTISRTKNSIGVCVSAMRMIISSTRPLLYPL